MPPETENPDTCGRLLRAHRLRAGLSQERLAKLAELSPRTIRQLEADRSRPRPGTLKILAETLELSDDAWARLFEVATPADRPGGETTAPTSATESADPDVPRRLPPAPGTFLGREQQVATLTDRAARHRLIVVDGMAGVGKTALVLYAAHHLAARFPDGQLFCDLRGFSGARPPLNTTEILNRLLRALGVNGRDIPADGEERAALWRHTVAERRLLIVLDNAATAEQVRPVLPGGSGSLVLVSSRRRLPELDEASPLTVDVLDRGTAVELFRRIANGTAVETEPIGEVVEVCGRLPLAIRMAAARLKNRPGWTIRELARRLARQESALTELDFTERGVSAAFESSYRDVTARQRRLFRLLALFPGDRFGTVAAARLLDVGEVEAEELLEQLVDSHLLLTPEPGRYEFHDLLRRFAMRMVERDESEPDTTAARRRMLETYRDKTLAAGILIGPTFLSATRDSAGDGHGITDLDTAVSWCRTEMTNILEMIDGNAELDAQAAMALGRGLTPYLTYHARYAELVSLSRSCVNLARRLGDENAEATWLNLEGLSHKQSTTDAVGELFTRSLRLRRRTGNLRGQASVLNNLGNFHMRRYEFGKAEAILLEAVQAAEVAGSKDLEGLARTNFVGMQLESRGADMARIGSMLTAARRIFEELGDERELARVRFYRGTMLRVDGDVAAAIRLHESVARYCRSQQEPTGELQAQVELARDHLAEERYDDAERHCARAAELIPAAGEGSRMWKRLRVERGTAAIGRGDLRAAVATLSEVLADDRDPVDVFPLRDAHRQLARAHAALGDEETARYHRSEAERFGGKPKG